MEEDDKCYFGLLNGLTRRIYYGENELSDDFLKNEIYPHLSDDEYKKLTAKCLGVIKSMVSADMDLNQLEAFLTSQVKKKDGGITDEQSQVFRKFWKVHKNKIHDSVVAQTSWNNTLKQVSWRIDLKSQSRHINQINSPSAIMELQVADSKGSEMPEIIRFEMDESKMLEILNSLKKIEDEINNHCQQ